MRQQSLRFSGQWIVLRQYRIERPQQKQGLFLQRLGLATRAAALARARPSQAAAQLSAAQRLLAPEGMGRLFKALAVCDAALPTPPGFEA